MQNTDLFKIQVVREIRTCQKENVMIYLKHRLEEETSNLGPLSLVFLLQNIRYKFTIHSLIKKY